MDIVETSSHSFLEKALPATSLLIGIGISVQAEMYFLYIFLTLLHTVSNVTLSKVADSYKASKNLPHLLELAKLLFNISFVIVIPLVFEPDVPIWILSILSIFRAPIVLKNNKLIVSSLFLLSVAPSIPYLILNKFNNGVLIASILLSISILIYVTVGHLKDRDKKLVISEAKNIESARLASLGQMAGGIAHEINNPLAIISGSLLILKKAKKNNKLSDEKFDDTILTIQSTIERISRTISSLKIVSKESSDQKKEQLFINEVLDSVLILYSEKFNRDGVELLNNFKDVTIDKYVYADRTHLSQAFFNIINNSYDSIKTSEDKWLKIELSEEQDNLIIKFIDSGMGIPLKDQHKVFTPFYTTKEVGKGTGLSLSISKSIIEENNGSLEIDNSAKNTCFLIKLPLSPVKSSAS